jgi:UDP-N-acetylglucosamine--dolichyl-phosphate N-acetylglucosaminephosphotransferase
MAVYYIAVGLFSFLVTYAMSYKLIPRLKRFGITGHDVNKPGLPEVAEMGGFGIVAGVTAGLLLAIFIASFDSLEFNLVNVLAAIITIHALAFIGIVDDLLDLPQWTKAVLPLFAAIPLVAVRAAGSTAINVPFVGLVDLGIFYILVLLPIGVAVASNLTNMFAGFNGMESGMGVVIFAAMSLLAIMHGSTEMALLFVAMLGALLAFLRFNWFPAKVFPGDVGNLTIGAVLASGVILGNLEMAGALMLLLYVIDFFLKAYNRFPSRNWWGEWKEGKLYAPEGRVRGFAQLVMKKANGISESSLVLFFIGLQIVVAAVVVLLFQKI